MNRSSFLKLSVLGLFVALAGCAAHQKSAGGSFKTFGEPKTTPAPSQQITTQALLANPEQYNGKYLSISGTVAQVCTQKGCWLSMGEGTDKPLFVKFTCPIEGRLIPMEAVGKPTIVEGTVTVIEMSQDEARHYQEDAGASPEEVAKIVGPQKRITVASPSARIAGL